MTVKLAPASSDHRCWIRAELQSYLAELSNSRLSRRTLKGNTTTHILILLARTGPPPFYHLPKQRSSWFSAGARRPEPSRRNFYNRNRRALYSPCISPAFSCKQCNKRSVWLFPRELASRCASRKRCCVLFLETANFGPGILSLRWHYLHPLTNQQIVFFFQYLTLV